MPLRTIALVHDADPGTHPHVTRQWPGSWPGGDSVVGNSLFIPRSGNRYRGDWLVCTASQPGRIDTDIPKTRRILFVLEPPEFAIPPSELLDQFGYVVSPYRLAGCSAVQIPGVTTGLFWWYGIAMDGHRPTGPFMSLAELRDEPVLPKSRLISTITSSKAFLPGHRSRLAFIALLQEAFGDLIDVFGHGIRPVADKRDALRPYQYHVALENSVHPNYWTEKLADPLLGRCVTFYHGAPSAAETFSRGSVVPIDIAHPYDAIETIVTTMKAGTIATDEIEASRHILLEHFNFPIYCDRLIDAIESHAAPLPSRGTSPGRPVLAETPA
jgi:hypothetical protein